MICPKVPEGSLTGWDAAAVVACAAADDSSPPKNGGVERIAVQLARPCGVQVTALVRDAAASRTGCAGWAQATSSREIDGRSDLVVDASARRGQRPFALVVDILATRHKPAGLDWGAADPFGALDAGWRPLLLSPGRRVLRVFTRL